MIDFIKGRIIEVFKNAVIIHSGGFGIKIETPHKFEKDFVKIYTYLLFKNETFKLYGFKTRESRDIFIKLININGIGVKHSFALLSELTEEQIIKAIENQDISLLTSVSGIGKKTAHRIILELKGKLDFEKISILNDVVLALENLGFEKSKIIPIVREIIKDTTNIEDIIKASLQKLSEKG